MGHTSSAERLGGVRDPVETASDGLYCVHEHLDYAL